MIREFRKQDVEQVEKLWHEYHADTFGLLNLNKSLDHAVAVKDNKILALGAIKPLAEAMIVLDLSLPRSTRVKTIIELLEAAIQQSRLRGLEQLHAFIKDEQYAMLLMERFGFEKIKDIPLVLNLEG